MCEYIKWIFNPDNINTNIFTVISVVLSGLISWGISAIYFSRGNRNNLRASVLCPIRRLLENKKCAVINMNMFVQRVCNLISIIN